MIGADGFGVFDVALVSQVFVVDTGDFHVDVDAVQERAADLLLTGGDGYGGIATFFDGVAVESVGEGLENNPKMDVKLWSTL